MEVTIQVDPVKEPELYERLCHASKILEETMGPRAARFVTAVEWSRPTDSGPSGSKNAIRLKMTDRLSGAVDESFQPAELRSPGFMKTQLREVWGRFLRQLSDEQMDRLDEMVSTLERD
jgi:hypothetical protein